MYLKLQDEHIRDSFAKVLWVKHIPSLKAFYCWWLLRPKIPIDEIFHRIGVSLASRCGLCKKEEKYFSHLFVHCSFAMTI